MPGIVTNLYGVWSAEGNENSVASAPGMNLSLGF